MMFLHICHLTHLEYLELDQVAAAFVLLFTEESPVRQRTASVVKWTRRCPCSALHPR